MIAHERRKSNEVLRQMLDAEIASLRAQIGELRAELNLLRSPNVTVLNKTTDAA